MAKGATEHDIDHEELLEAQRVFKGPRYIRKNLFGQDEEGNSD